MYLYLALSSAIHPLVAGIAQYFSALYDKAFDKGLIGIDEQYKILLSKNIKKNKEAIYYDKYFAPLENQTLTLPQKYLPKKEFIQYHLDVIFQKI